MRRFFKVVLLIFLPLCMGLFITLNILFPLKVNINYSRIVTAADGTIIHSMLSKDEKWRMRTDKSEISEIIERAFLYKEDRWFYWHFGVNPFSVVRAAANNILKGKRTSGASTITMQLSRLLYPKKRTYFNKLTEMFHAIQLECYYSKKEILCMYFTLVPYGGNIEGIKAAALLYYGQPPDKLSIAQVAALVIVPNNPNTLTPRSDNKKLLSERNKWLQRMKNDRLFSDNEIDDAVNEPLNANRRRNTSIAPHFSVRMAEMFPKSTEIHTALNRQCQEKVNTIASNYCKRLHAHGIYNTSVLVINNRTGCVEAYLGSADVNDDLHNGQVDGVMAIRSPGSTLKPFVYAQAFDNGLATPKSIIADVPVNFNGYEPENFNSRFNGNVTVETALSNSLNIPAVKVLDKLGIQTFIEKLSQTGFKQIRKDSNKLGLSSILGGCGVTLEELTALYAAFAHEGKYSSIHWLNDKNTPLYSTCFSPESAYMISEILSTLSRPDLPNNFQSSLKKPKVAWKTGTSYGRRDAWSIGYNKNYTIGVWVGNFSGAGVPELTGADAATPLLFEIFNSIDYNSRTNWFLPPDKLDFRLVCSESGNVPDVFCNNQVIDYYIPGISSARKCTHEKELFVSPDESYSYCTSCLPRAGYKVSLYPDLEPDLINYYNSEMIVYKKMPPHNPSCSRIFVSRPPVITSPVNKKEYLVPKDEDQQLMLSCNSGNEVKIVYWYLNDRFYKSCSAGESVFFKPEPGKIKISCSDDKGRNSNIFINVNYF